MRSAFGPKIFQIPDAAMRGSPTRPLPVTRLIYQPAVLVSTCAVQAAVSQTSKRMPCASGSSFVKFTVAVWRRM